MKKFYLALLFAVASVTMCAQTPLTFSSENSNINPDGIKASRTTKTTLQSDANRSATKKRLPSLEPLRTKDVGSEYGTVVELLYEDFSKFNTGSIGNPDTTTNIHIPEEEQEYPWWNIDPKWTKVPHWGAHNACPAGGCLLLNADATNQQAQINTALVDASGHCGIVFLQFKARTLEGFSTGLIVEGAETRSMGATWDFMGLIHMPEVTQEWQTYTIKFYGGGPTTMFNIFQSQQGPIYIDDIKIYQIDQYVDTPVTLRHTEYTGKSFKANWTASEGAEGYLIDVYSYDNLGDQIVLIKDRKVEGTSYTVENIESGKTYYYTVRAVKGEHQSIVSTPQEVFDLEAPILSEETKAADGKYTATWNAVPSAERYNYWAYYLRNAEAEGEFVICDEDFTGVRDAEGNLTGLTVENPSPNTYDHIYIQDMKQAGWEGTHYMPYTDFVCVDGWQYVAAKQTAGLHSPELDLSKDNGKIKISVRLCGENCEVLDENGKTIHYPTQCAIALFNYSENTGKYEQVELVYPGKDNGGVGTEWKTFEANLTKGSSRSIIGIFAVTAPGNLYIDDLKITQKYKKGETFLDPFQLSSYYEGTSLEVTIPEKTYNHPIFHKVSAIKLKDPYSKDKKESLFSKLLKVTDGMLAAQKVPSATESKIKIVDDSIRISNLNGDCVEIYTVDGVRLFTDNSGQQEIIFTPKNPGSYMVKVGSEVIKVTF